MQKCFLSASAKVVIADNDKGFGGTPSLCDSPDSLCTMDRGVVTGGLSMGKAFVSCLDRGPGNGTKRIPEQKGDMDKEMMKERI